MSADLHPPKHPPMTVPNIEDLPEFWDDEEKAWCVANAISQRDREQAIRASFGRAFYPGLCDALHAVLDAVRVFDDPEQEAIWDAIEKVIGVEA